MQSSDAPVATLPIEPPAQAHTRVNPWLFVPVLYIMQGMPVTTVQEVFGITYKDLFSLTNMDSKLANATIASWTSIVALPWTLKLFWGPLVDLNFTKRSWILVTQALLVGAFLLLAGGVTMASFFPVTIALLMLMAVLSATHDIAADGFYILSQTREQQAKFVGIQGTGYKIGKWLCVGALVWFAGKLQQMGWSIRSSWVCFLLICAGVYGAFWIYNLVMLPRPVQDRPAVETAPEETRRDIFRTIAVVSLGVCIYFVLASGIRLCGHHIQMFLNASRVKPILLEWKQEPHDVKKWWIIFAISVCAFFPMLKLAGVAIRGTPLAQSFSTYVRQRGFWSILFFILFYRFGEAMITRTLALFFKDSQAVGGLGISTAQYGLINGFAGVWGIIIGGLIGGVIVSKLGLRRSFWPLAICMHAPNLLYLWIAAAYHHDADPNRWCNLVLFDWPLYLAVFTHEFTYGFGFAAYFVFLMDVAQRNNFKTSHYAIGTGLGALCSTLAGITGAILLASVSYVGFFIAVCLLSIPGLLSLLLIPLDGAGEKVTAAPGGH